MRTAGYVYWVTLDMTPSTRHTTSTAARGLLVALAVLAAALLLSACGSSGPTQEEYDALAAELQSARRDLNAALSRISAEESKVAQAQRQLQEYRQQVELEKAAALEQEQEGIITLARARLEAIRFAQRNTEMYAGEYRDQPLVWEVENATEDSEFFYVTLTHKPFAGFAGTPGREEFIIDKAGRIEFRQVLSDPVPEQSE